MQGLNARIPKRLSFDLRQRVEAVTITVPVTLPGTRGQNEAIGTYTISPALASMRRTSPKTRHRSWLHPFPQSLDGFNISTSLRRRFMIDSAAYCPARSTRNLCQTFEEKTCCGSLTIWTRCVPFRSLPIPRSSLRRLSATSIPIVSAPSDVSTNLDVYVASR